MKSVNVAVIAVAIKPNATHCITKLRLLYPRANAPSKEFCCCSMLMVKNVAIAVAIGMKKLTCIGIPTMQAHKIEDSPWLFSEIKFP